MGRFWDQQFFLNEIYVFYFIILYCEIKPLLVAILEFNFNDWIVFRHLRKKFYKLGRKSFYYLYWNENQNASFMAKYFFIRTYIRNTITFWKLIYSLTFISTIGLSSGIWDRSSKKNPQAWGFIQIIIISFLFVLRFKYTQYRSLLSVRFKYKPEYNPCDLL